MRKNLVIIIGIILFTTLLCGLAFGCAVPSPIVGKWVGSTETMEFTRDGDVIYKSDTMLITGKYELIGSDVVKFKFDTLFSFPSDTYQYEISGDTITFRAGKMGFDLKRSSK